MTTAELIDALMFEYYATQAANPEWDVLLWDFLRGRGISADSIWEYAAYAGWQAKQPEPDWM